MNGWASEFMREKLLDVLPLAAIAVLYAVARLWVVPKLRSLEAAGEMGRAKRIRRAIAFGYFVACVAGAVAALALLFIGLLPFFAGLFCAAFMVWLGVRSVAIFRRPERLDNTLLFGGARTLDGNGPALRDGGITGSKAFRLGRWLRQFQGRLRRGFRRP